MQSLQCIKTFITCLSILAPTSYGLRPACDIPPADYMEPTSITCYFPEKVFLSKSDFKVLHVSRNISVINATWEDGEYMFSLDEGFSMDGQKNLTDQVTFKLPHATRKLTGRYACMPVGYGWEDVGICKLSLNPGGPSEPTERNSIENVSERGYITMAVPVLFLAAFVIPSAIFIIVMIFVFTYSKQQIYRRDRGSKDIITVGTSKSSLLKLQDNGYS